MVEISKALKEFEEKNKLIQSLKKYSFEFGVLTQDEFKTVKVSILNPDETMSEAFMSVGEIMYLTEHGTIMLPARPILTPTIPYILERLDFVLNEILDGVFNFNWNESKIKARLHVFETEINLFVQEKVLQVFASNNYLSNLIGEDPEKSYLLDINQLKNYIHFKIIAN